MPQHENTHDIIHYSLKKEINEYYLSAAIKNFGVGLVGLFGPIYVFLYFDQSVIATMTFYLLQYIAITLLVPITVHTIEKWGLKKSMAIGNPILSLYLLCLMFAQSYGFVFIVLAAIARVLYVIIFFPSRHVDFAKFTTSKKTGHQLSTINIIITVVKVIAPLLGGIIITNFGFPPVFTLSAFLIFISMLPLFSSPEIYEHYSFSYWQTFAFPFKKENRRTAIAFFFEGIESVAVGSLFSIFIYIVIGNFETIGWITSTSLFLLVFMIYFIGHITDKKGDRNTMSITSTINSVSWILNAFIITPFHYLIYSSVYRMASTAHHLSFNSLYYKKAHQAGHGADEYVIFHEVVINFGRVIMCSIIIAGFYFGATSFLPYFILAAFSVLMFRLIR